MAAAQVKESGFIRKGVCQMNIELNQAERDLLQKVIDTYLSELRQTIAATKRGTSTLHEEEELLKGLQTKLG
jgi:hypothetical protein